MNTKQQQQQISLVFFIKRLSLILYSGNISLHFFPFPLSSLIYVYFPRFLFLAGNPINYSPVRSLGSKQDFIGSTESAQALKEIDSTVHGKFELEKLPKEMTQSQNNINEQNGSTIILNPTLLTTATDGQNIANNGNSGGGGGPSPTVGGGCCDDGVYQGPKM